MIKRIILTVIIIGITVMAGRVVIDSYRLMGHDNIAVSQLKDSDENVVMLNASTRLIKQMRIIQLIVVGGALYFIWGGYVRRLYRE